ncbi:SNF2-related protein [Ancylothrix sp. C2]|uniref:helicase-related protein n=1 Tax=Ancylothrix sp. D3o TaxID=2953691 RepID=UPI0021BB3A37|nr:helicase-related protein [Ancylothrix sp. D3o]MCT7951729.1 SNF2-related protein [Ancylothrix sp. D3o]
MPLPDYIDNSQHKLENLLNILIEDEKQDSLDIATGFFRIEAWLRLETAMNQLKSLRLLIGRDPAIRPAEPANIDLIKHFRHDIQQQLETQEFNAKYKQQIDRIITYLLQDNIHVRLFGAQGNTPQFLHAKAYIFDHYSIVGSSNFTPAGINGNTELNLLNKIAAVAHDLRYNWFEKFWNHPSVDLDYKAKLIDTLNASKFGSKAYTPHQVFLKALYELFKDDTLTAEAERTSLELASFQQEGFARAVKLIEKHNGCIVADAVGLGKTFIGLRLLDYYLIREKRPGKIPRALVLCPAQLRDLVWIKKLDEFGIKADIISHEEISRQTFNIQKYNNYDIIIVDEAHNFRNSATNRYQNLLKLVSTGKRTKRLALLTATPINNSIYDIYHQVLLLTRGNETYYHDWGISNLKTYFKALDKGGVEITELLMETMVRRSRQDVIRRQQAGEEIRINGKIIKFPKRQLEQFTYNFEETFSGLYSNLGELIDQLNLSPYNIKAFKKSPEKQDNNEIKRNQALTALQKTLYFKRFESSLIAFKRSIQMQRDFQEKFYQILSKENKLLDSKNFRKLIIAAADEQEENTSIDEIINTLTEVDPKDYDINQIKEQIQADLTLLNNILTTLNKIESSATDCKLVKFKNLLKTELTGQKLIIFTYFKDTADYLYNQLIQDSEFISQVSTIDKITGDTSPKQREEKVKRFAPKANAQSAEELSQLQQKPIDILICTDVLSEGQNLQDAGILINYDLHWNPVRMIQRAGRIDRLGTDYNELLIYNCFPEQGLDDLLGLVKRLQQRIATIDREVGLDGSVLGEIISEKSLEELYKLKHADSDAEKQAILDELEQTAELVSLDELRLPLLEFLQNDNKQIIEDIPFGIHSTWQKTIYHPHQNVTEGGIFLAFRARDRHFWHFYPCIDGFISLDAKNLITDKRMIFNWLKCKASDFPPPDTLRPVEFDYRIFSVLETAVSNLLNILQKQQTGKSVKPSMTKLLQKINYALIQPNLFQQNPILDEDAKQRVLKILTTVNSRSYERDIKLIWEAFTNHKNLSLLLTKLDEYFLETGHYSELDEPTETRPVQQSIKKQDIQLICYQWFKP